MPHAHDTTLYLLRGALYLGVFLLLGAGVFVRYVGQGGPLASRWRLWYMLVAGFMLAWGATLYGAYHTVWMLGDPALLGRYFLETQQGAWLLLRLLLLPLLLGLSLGWLRGDAWLYPPLALALLLTVSLTGHAAGGGVGEVLADLLHLGLGVVWGGSLLALVVVWPTARHEARLRALERLSALGLVAVLGVALSGVGLAASRLPSIPDLWTTAYGQRLLVKLALVGLVLLLAGLNRLWFLPRLRAKGVQGPGPVALEAALLLGVLLATGVLAGTEPPRPVPSLVDIREPYGAHRFVGQLFSQAGVIHLYLDLRDPEGNLLASGPTLRVRFEKGGQAHEEALAPYHRSQYHLAYLAEAGVWRVELELPSGRLDLALRVDR
ncbi:copper resistance protein [Meiothermus sp. QL-1]|uniref:CopD family protein n=1 Tax=Meiothermus sp. QL-1 TaxID=2058095 RepID=UPI000E0A1F44|nr:CopD family protein [Meiothermus sp. QL-1]RDI94885.1 copper resistance protein [Meiothermus sp. QL-1]